MPLPLLFFALAIVWWFLPSNTRAKRTLGAILVALFTLSFEPAANALLEPLENAYPPLASPPKETRYVMILGSSHAKDRSYPVTSTLSPEAVVRLTEGIRLLNQSAPDTTLIVSGYGGNGTSISHARLLEKLARSLGVRKNRIRRFDNTKDTYEEARHADAFCDANATLVLVTSAYHMPRAVRLFRRHTHLHIVPAPTFRLALSSKGTLSRMLNAEALTKSTRAFHEYLGMMWYALRDRFEHKP